MRNPEPKNTAELDAVETREWLESLDYVLQHGGAAKAARLLRELTLHAAENGVRFPFSANTAYINTIPAEDQVIMPGSQDLERRITFPDVIRAIAEQTEGLFREDDFLPLPCAHPNCHSLTYAYRSAGAVVPLPRFIDARNHLEILANGILFTRNRARQLIEQYLAKLGCCGHDLARDNGDSASQFFRRALEERHLL